MAKLRCHNGAMTLLLSLSAAVAALLLLFGRTRRLAKQPPLPAIDDPRPRALAEAAASGVAVLIVAYVFEKAVAPAPAYVAPVFTALAMAICLAQFFKTMRRRSTASAL